MGKHYFVGLLALAAIVCALFFSIAHCLGRSPHSAANHRERAIAKSSARNAPEFTRPAARKSLARRAASKPQARFFTTQTTFEPNVGQAGPEASFVGRGKGIAVLLEQDGFAVLVPNRRKRGPNDQSAVKIHLVNADPLSWAGEEKLRGETNYFIGNDPRKWRTRVAHYARAKSIGDPEQPAVVVYGNEEGVEYDLRIPPGADVSRFRLALTGATRLKIGNGGDLLINVGGNEIRMRKPIIYEERPGAIQNTNPAPAHSRRSGTAKPRSTTRTKSAASTGPKKRTRRSPSTAARKEQRHRAKRKMRGSSARPPAMKRPRANPPQRNKRPPKVDRPTLESFSPRKGSRIDGGYILESDGTVGFRVARHNANATLVLDPSISIVYSSFIGGTGNDSANSLAMDSAGNLYVGGTTTSAATFTEQGSASLGPTEGAADLFVAKIDPTKSGADSLVYLTFIGGSAIESGGLVAVDAAGNLAIAGTTTSVDYPVTDTSKLTTGTNDATVTEIDPTGSKLVYSTIFGGNGVEAAQGSGGIALDASGNIFVSSDTSSTNLPVTSGAFQPTYGGGISDGFLAVFQPSTAPHLKYCTYLGINAEAAVGGVAVDAAGNAYLAGFTTDPGTTFPTKNAFQGTYAGDPDDSFLMKIFPGANGVADLIYATLLGGGDLDEAYAVAVDTETPPNAYVTGTTQSTNFPTSGSVAAYQTALHANATANAFLSVIAQNPTTGATSLAYSTYLGGSEIDAGQAITLIAANSVYVTGSTVSFDFPWLNNLQPYNGNGDAFVAKLDPTSAGAASLIYSTPLAGSAPTGGTVTAQGQGIAAGIISGNASVYLVGQTTAADFPTAGNLGNGFQLICGSCQETPPASNGFVIQIQESAADEPSVYFSAPNLNFGSQIVGATNVPPESTVIYNGGSAPLQITSIGITGPNGGDFSLLNSGVCVVNQIAPGSSCSLGVGFVPSTVGPESAAVSFTTNAPGNPQILEIVGTGAGPIATLSSTTLDFGNQAVGTQSLWQTIALTNTGNTQLTLSSATESGANVGDFPPHGGNSCLAGLAINAGGTCSFVVAFAPTASGNFAAQLTFIDNSGGVVGSQQIVQLMGVGGTSSAPIAVVQPAMLQFGTVGVGSTGSAQTVTLTNTGSAGLSLTNISIAGPNANEFGIASSGSNPCPIPSGTVVSGANCTVAVFFAPQTGGAKSASLNFADDASGSPQIVQLTGAATTPTIQFSAASLSFTPQSEGITSAAQTVTLTNSGSAALSITNIAVAGANPTDFAATNNCPPTLAGGASCVLSVSFKPLATGSRMATVNVSDNAPGSPQVISLSGTGTQASVSFAPASISFGGQQVGTSSSPVTVTVTNNGSGSLAFSSAIATGMNTSDFTIAANTCAGANVSVAPTGTCTMQVTFTPTCANSPVARSATLTLTDNAPGSPQSIPLAGTAAGNFCVVAPAASLTATVAPGATATYSLNVMAADGFTGTVMLSATGCPPEGTCSVSPASMNIAGNLQVPFHVTVATSSTAMVTERKLPRGLWPKTLRTRFVFSNIRFYSREFEGLLLLAAIIAMMAGTRQSKARHRRLLQTAALAAYFALSLTACGGGSTNTGGGGSDLTTPAGTYTISLTGTANGSAQTTSLTLIVN